MQVPESPPGVRLLHDPTEGLEQLAFFTGSDIPLAQTVAEGLGLSERSQEALPADLPTPPPPAQAAAVHVPERRLAGAGRVTAILQQRNIEARNLARTGCTEGQPPIVRCHDLGQRQGEFHERAIHGASTPQHEAPAQ